MVNSRKRGQVYEREIAKALEDIFPNAHRNWLEQSAIGGQDLNDTGIFSFEIKGGKQANIAKVRQWLDQSERESPQASWNVVIARPHRTGKNGGGNYVLMDWDVFLEILNQLKAENVI